MKFFAAALIASLTFGLNLREMEEGDQAKMQQFDADSKDTSDFIFGDNQGSDVEKPDMPECDSDDEECEKPKPATKKERDGEDMPEGEKPDMPECASDDETCEKPEDMPECSSDDETCEKPERKGGNGDRKAKDATTDGQEKKDSKKGGKGAAVLAQQEADADMPNGEKPEGCDSEAEDCTKPASRGDSTKKPEPASDAEGEVAQQESQDDAEEPKKADAEEPKKADAEEKDAKKGGKKGKDAKPADAEKPEKDEPAIGAKEREPATDAEVVEVAQQESDDEEKDATFLKAKKGNKPAKKLGAVEVKE